MARDYQGWLKPRELASSHEDSKPSALRHTRRSPPAGCERGPRRCQPRVGRGSLHAADASAAPRYAGSPPPALLLDFSNERRAERPALDVSRAQDGAELVVNASRRAADNGNGSWPNGLDAAPLDVGEYVVGHRREYQLLEFRGRGSVAEVWAAKSGDQVFAVKFVRPDRGLLVPDAVSAMTRRFATEARRFARMGHACLVRFADRGLHRGRPFLVLELASYSIREVLLRFGPLTAAQSARTVLAAASALQYVHGRHLVHRGVKPSNILQCSRGLVLSELGIVYGDDLRDGSRRAASAPKETAEPGPARYMAPELLEPPYRAGPPSDLYALGITWHEMLVGSPPGAGAFVEREAPPPSVLGEVNDLVARLTRPDADARPSVDEVIRATSRLIAP